MTQDQHNERAGCFTSSEVVALLAVGSRPMTKDELKAREKGDKRKTVPYWGKAALTYIEEVNLERMSGECLDQEVETFNLQWGKVCEKFVLTNCMGWEWEGTGDKTLTHPEIPYWKGTPDALTRDLETMQIHPPDLLTVGEIKCPATRKSFLQFAVCKDIQEVIEKHPDGKKYWCQVLSNACITGARYAELHIYMPMQDQLPEIIRLAELEGYNWAYRNLPRLTKYKNNHLLFRWEVEQKDREHLTSLVRAAGEQLIGI